VVFFLFHILSAMNIIIYVHNVLFGFTHFEITILNELICSVNLKNFGLLDILFNGYDSIIICII
jgi:hypothetical protein